MTRDNLELRSTLYPDGEVQLSLDETTIAPPGTDEIVVEMHAAPLHPVDMAMLFARSDPATATRGDRGGRPVTLLRATAPIAGAQRARWNTPLPLGTEGAGHVVAAGASDSAQALAGTKVALWGGGTYARYRTVKAVEAMPLPATVSTIEGAFAHLNPLTALGMIEAMRMEGHRALVHTAAASTIGQILCRLCREEDIPLVNIVRRSEHVALLHSIGAMTVCNSSADLFEAELAEALRTTNATMLFDATGGGDLASRILHRMEENIVNGKPFDHGGSDIRKRAFIYGTLDPAPLTLLKNFGWSWDVGGYVVFDLLRRIGPERTTALKRRVASGLKSTFAISHGRTIGLRQLTDPDVLRDANRRATGEKLLIDLRT